MIEHLRDKHILLPGAATMEKIALAARAIARKRAHKNLVEGLPRDRIAALEALLTVIDEQGRTPIAWSREWPEAPRQKSLVGIIKRLQAVRELGVEPDHERRIHQARYAAIARETAILSAQRLSRFDTHRRSSCSCARWKRSSPTPLSPYSAKCAAPCSAAPKTSTRRISSSAPRRSTLRHGRCRHGEGDVSGQGQGRRPVPYFKSHQHQVTPDPRGCSSYISPCATSSPGA